MPPRAGLLPVTGVRLFNPQGKARIAVRLTEDMIPGVVCLPEGVWVELDGSGVDVGGAANMFTSTQGTRPAPPASCMAWGSRSGVMATSADDPLKGIRYS